MIKIKQKTKMQYKVPQDVQREDTIIGPITLRQLIILGIGGFIAYAIYISLAKTYFMEIWLPPVAVVSAITLAFAFLKVYNMPFHLFMMRMIEYYFIPRKRVWIQGTGYPFVSPFDHVSKKVAKKIEKQEQKEQKTLQELTNILDTHGESALSQREKKEGLEKIIEQNYQQTK